ncbi:hypothetical protein PAXRUDRAFT_821926 [Paxillus rubicundulus Ve08.2h10]|uniref:Uncharacterized protein n=1 Tax=Paxillus rubicundulus Ve08.2h10 TaxID=930991 RepID=A0A0D0E5W1_9AGAM|nr:hypothetical protein PAXRUDRAFT_821926 [Paxillus rubicundulus Ve08.2h10]
MEPLGPDSQHQSFTYTIRTYVFVVWSDRVKVLDLTRIWISSGGHECMSLHQMLMAIMKRC